MNDPRHIIISVIAYSLAKSARAVILMSPKGTKGTKGGGLKRGLDGSDYRRDPPPDVRWDVQHFHSMFTDLGLLQAQVSCVVW
jgi:hypothetical protein